MKKGLYKIATLIAIANFISCILGGITITTSLLRSMIVFIGTLFVFALFMIVLRWGLTNNFFLQNDNLENQESKE